MKVNVEVDCTPMEARQFFGLPDVQPMQTAVMDKMQQQMMANIEKVSPESLIQSWFTFDPKIAERFQDMFVTMAGLGGMGQEGQEISGRRGGAAAEEQRLRPPSLFLMLAEARGLFELNSSLCCRRCCCARRRATDIRCWRCRAFSPAICRWRRCGAI